MSKRVLQAGGWTLRSALDPDDPMLVEWAEQVGGVDREQLQQAEEQAEEQLRRAVLERWQREDAARRQRAAEAREQHRRYLEELAARKERQRLARENETDEQRAKRLARNEYQRELREWRKRMDAKDREQAEREAEERAEQKARERIIEAERIARARALLTWYAERAAGEYDFGQERSFARRRLRETGYHVHSITDPVETEDLETLDNVLRANGFRGAYRRRAA